ncbi:MAG TPA: AI-2E family transporter [Chloroflexi bacterium]|nr:AI-2E family transporter [Chloroflexota bacterium]
MIPSDKIAPITYALAGVALVGIVLVLASWASPALTPIMLAWFMASLALPGYFALQKRGVKSGIALLLLILILLVGGVALVLLFINSLNTLQEGLQLYLGDLDQAAADLQAALGERGVNMEVSQLMGSAGLGKVLASFLPALINAAGNFLFALVLVAFILLEAPRFQRLVQNDLADRPVLREMPRVMKTAVTYFGIRTRLNLMTGVGFGLWLLLLGVDYALLWGILTFVLSYIPYIGLFTAMIPPTILAIAEFGLFRGALVVVGAVVFNLAVENVLEPSYTGKKLRLSPTVVFISFFLWGWLLGPVGALLSMPITVTLMLILDQHESTQWIAKIIGRE